MVKSKQRVPPPFKFFERRAFENQAGRRSGALFNFAHVLLQQHRCSHSIFSASSEGREFFQAGYTVWCTSNS